MSSKRIYVFYFFLLTLVGIKSGLAKSPLLSFSRGVKKFLGYSKDSWLTFRELTDKNGYPTEEHTVHTQDGYRLTMFRIPKGKNCSVGNKARKVPVILMHGLLQSSNAWIDSGPDAGLAYLIADECHDLWVGNCRGSFYSRQHDSLNPNKGPKYWQFSFDEIAYYDVPTMIDYVLDNTGSKVVNYIGFSQGAGTVTAMCSERPNYCRKVQVLIALSPATRMLHTTSPVFRFLAESSTDLESVLAKLGIYEVLPQGGAFQTSLEYLCQHLTGLCRILFNSIETQHPNSITDKAFRTLVGHFPAGTSVHNMAWFGQSMRSQDFHKFDYGQLTNLKRYGSVTPPKYNLGLVSAPVVVLYGLNDGVVDPRDVKWMANQLPNIIEVKEVNDPLWNHLDHTYSKFTSNQIFPRITEYLLKYS